MKPNIIAFSIPKLEEASSTNQDRYAIGSEGAAVAIADGAGSTLYPGQWAEILVQAFCNGAGDPIEAMQRSLPSWLLPLQEAWRQFYLAKLQAPSKQWWQGGSTTKSYGAATFLGWALHPQAAAGRWAAIAVGDSCLFQFNPESQALKSFPLQTSAEFKSTSTCWASLPEYPSATPHFTGGTYDAGDVFLLATDALSQWILSGVEQKKHDWQQIFQIKHELEFQDWIHHLRQTQALKNDDTSLVLIQMPSPPKPTNVSEFNDEVS